MNDIMHEQDSKELYIWAYLNQSLLSKQKSYIIEDNLAYSTPSVTKR